MTTPPAKYFFVSAGWRVSRVWELGGLWDENVWRRPPEIRRLNLGIVEQSEQFWLYQVEEAVLMVEISPLDSPDGSPSAIGQVLLKRLITAEQAIERLQSAEQIFNQAPLN